MTENGRDETEIKGKLFWEKSSKRFERYRIVAADVDLVGTVYLGKGVEQVPKRLILEVSE